MLMFKRGLTAKPCSASLIAGSNSQRVRRGTHVLPRADRLLRGPARRQLGRLVLRQCELAGGEREKSDDETALHVGLRNGRHRGDCTPRTRRPLSFQGSVPYILPHLVAAL